jgi:hypothetical protein
VPRRKHCLLGFTPPAPNAGVRAWVRADAAAFVTACPGKHSIAMPLLLDHPPCGVLGVAVAATRAKRIESFIRARPCLIGIAPLLSLRRARHLGCYVRALHAVGHGAPIPAASRFLEQHFFSLLLDHRYIDHRLTIGIGALQHHSSILVWLLTERVYACWLQGLARCGVHGSENYSPCMFFVFASWEKESMQYAECRFGLTCIICVIYDQLLSPLVICLRIHRPRPWTSGVTTQGRCTFEPQSPTKLWDAS